MSRWFDLVLKLQMPDAQNYLSDITDRYTEKHRAYHNLQHINSCLDEFDSVRDHFDQPDTVELALWLHDVIYDTHANDNEQQSAEYSVLLITKSGGSKQLGEHVHYLIMTTTHKTVPVTLDGQLLVDIDLSILGATQDRYAEFEKAIRSEYEWVPWNTYVVKRVEVLQSFLSRDSIYATQHFRAKYEAAARLNLERAIADLQTRRG